MGGSTSGNSNIKPEKEYEIEEGGEMNRLVLKVKTVAS